MRVVLETMMSNTLNKVVVRLMKPLVLLIIPSSCPVYVCLIYRRYTVEYYVKLYGFTMVYDD